MTPLTLRKSFVTHLIETGQPDHVLESAAVAMDHSRDMQRSTYNKLSRSDMSAAALNVSEALAFADDEDVTGNAGSSSDSNDGDAAGGNNALLLLQDYN